MAENTNSGTGTSSSAGEFGDGRQAQNSSQNSSQDSQWSGSQSGSSSFSGRDSERPLTVQNERSASASRRDNSDLGDGSVGLSQSAPTEAASTNGARRTGTRARGFASMDPAKQREIASKGGRAAHAKGTAHEWSSDEARSAGRKGGEAVSRDRAHMSAIGREGGEASRGSARRNRGASSASSSSNGDSSSDNTSDLTGNGEG
jgi:uncharacterized protein